jgi:hypothetical protein
MHISIRFYSFIWDTFSHIFSSNILCTQMKLEKVIIKVHTKSSKIKVASKNFHALCVVRLIFGFLYILPMLECAHALIKIVQSRNVFVCDFVEYQVGQQRIILVLFWSFIKYEFLIFNDFNLVDALTNESLPLS